MWSEIFIFYLISKYITFSLCVELFIFYFYNFWVELLVKRKGKKLYLQCPTVNNFLGSSRGNLLAITWYNCEDEYEFGRALNFFFQFKDAGWKLRPFCDVYGMWSWASQAFLEVFSAFPTGRNSQTKGIHAIYHRWWLNLFTAQTPL